MLAQPQPMILHVVLSTLPAVPREARWGGPRLALQESLSEPLLDFRKLLGRGRQEGRLGRLEHRQGQRWRRRTEPTHGAQGDLWLRIDPLREGIHGCSEARG